MVPAGERFTPQRSNNDQHTIDVRWWSHRDQRNPREGRSRSVHSITTHSLEPEIRFREQAIQRRRLTTPTAGMILSAITLGEIGLTGLLLMMTRRLISAAGRNLLDSLYSATACRWLTQSPNATGSRARGTDLASNQKNEQPAEHIYILSREGAQARGINSWDRLPANPYAVQFLNSLSPRSHQLPRFGACQCLPAQGGFAFSEDFERPPCGKTPRKSPGRLNRVPRSIQFTQFFASCFAGIGSSTIFRAFCNLSISESAVFRS